MKKLKARKITLDSVAKEILAFNKVRGWHPVSSDIAKSVVIEAAELLEKFQWDASAKDINGVEPKNWEEIGDEIADVFWYLITFCNAANINFAGAVKRKLKKLEVKYPAGMFKGKHNDKFYKTQKRKYREAKKKYGRTSRSGGN